MPIARPAERRRAFVSGADALSLSPWEHRYRELIFGGDAQPITLDLIRGLDAPIIRTDITPRGADHGAKVFARFYDERHIAFSGQVTGRTPAERAALIEALDAAFAPAPTGTDPLVLQFLLGSGVLKRLYAVPSRPPAIDVSPAYAKGDVIWAAELVAADPRIYADDEQMATIKPASSSPGGVIMPVVFPLYFDSGPSGFARATNEGTFETRPTVHIDGPATNPKLVNVTAGVSVQVDVALSATDYLDIDFAERTIILDGSASRYSGLTTTSEWWGLLPGENLVQFVADGVSDATLATIRWRSAWSIAT